MLSAMTTSENFSLNSRSRCSTSPYRNVARSAFGSSIRDECREFLLEGNFTSAYEASKDDFVPVYSSQLIDEQNEMLTTSKVNSSEVRVSDEVPNIESETDINELLEQLDLEDISLDQVKSLSIDQNILKLDFPYLKTENSTVSSETYYKSIDEFCTDSARGRKRVSHHLSGGGILLSSSQESASCKMLDIPPNNRFFTVCDAGSTSAENVFDFDDLNYFAGEEDECKSSNFINQISPSSPLTFDLAVQTELNNITKGNSTQSESTNPFNNFLKDVLDKETTFSSTNPFASPNFHSSLDQLSNPLPPPPPEYENLSVAEKSFSRCSTRPASPVHREEPNISNPFLLNQTSPQSCPQMNLTQFFLNDGQHFSNPTIQNPSSSFIFAVPVFPIFQHQIANSSTQTTEPSEPEQPERVVEPVYQNVTSQLKKFMQQNNHSEYDLQCLKTTMKDLKNCGWYYENVSWQESIVLLKDTEPGTFLIRDSSDPNFLFSLSVQTSRGPTSVRLHYVNGQFRLDAEKKLIPHMPSFNSVIELIDYYIENTVKNKFANASLKKSDKKNGKEKLQKSKEQVWIDSQGNIYSNILLVKPLYKKEHFSTLQHLTRLVINRHIKNESRRRQLDFRVTPVYESSPFQDSSFPISFDSFCPVVNVDDLPLPITLINYLKDYPYSH